MQAFLVLLAVGAAALAVWFDARFERLAPRTFGAALIHAVIALAAGWLVAPLAIKEAVTLGLSPVVVLVGIALPSLIYLFLAALWVLKQAQAHLVRR